MNLKQNKGITLLTLMMTVLVIVMLLGVSITIVSKQNIINENS